MYKHGGDIYTYKGMLDFSANLNPLGLPNSVLAAAQAGCAASAAYPDPLCRELTQALAHHEHLSAEHIICGNGAADLIFRLAMATHPGRALLIAPGFSEYEQALLSVNCHIDHFFLREENGWQLDQSYIAALQTRPDIVFICNPNNPTGLTVNQTLLQNIVAATARLNIRLVIDECFNDFLDDGNRHTAKPLLAANSHIFILKAFTKTYAMAGLRLGYGLCTDTALLAAMAEAAQPWSVSTPAQAAGVAALGEHAYVERARQLVAQQRRRLTDGLNSLGCQTYGSSANYIFFRAKPGLTEACRRRNVLIRDCSNYHGLCPGYYRIAVKLPAENDRLLQVLAAALAEL